jgi:hypothetical protein
MMVAPLAGPSHCGREKRILGERSLANCLCSDADKTQIEDNVVDRQTQHTKEPSLARRHSLPQ